MTGQSIPSDQGYIPPRHQGRQGQGFSASGAAELAADLRGKPAISTL
jgi:hypothetical protein